VWIWLALLGLLSVWLAPLHAQSQPKKTPSKSEKPASLKAPASDGKPQPLVINADRMETLKKEGLIIFQGRVEARHNNNTQYAD
jgi:lipopolysaccharide assembly outer membrane protein LptD (OstA)